MSYEDLRRHLSAFKIIELEGSHDVTTGKHNSEAKLKIRVKNNNEASL